MSVKLASFQPDIALNLGAMIRLTACFAIPLEVIEPCGFPFSLRALRRSAMDYGDLANVRRHDSWNDYLKNRDEGRLILMTTDGAVPLWNFRFQEGDTILMGRESAGVTPEVRAKVDAGVVIPMPGGGRSLNVAMSAGIAVAEAARQLR